MRYKVTILQHRLLHYRVEFFSLLRELLEADGVDLRLVHGQASASEQTRKDEGSLDWADKIVNKYWNVKGVDLCWQPIPADVRDSDLVVLMQENRLLSNYPLLLRRMLFGGNLAYWGHGANFQSAAPKGVRERWKNWLLTKVDWWFAYTSATVEIVTRAGFPPERITCLNNAIDTTAFRQLISEITESEQQGASESLGIPRDAKIGLFCGSLYPEKKLELLVAASDLIHEAIPDFRLVVIGDGPSGAYLRAEFASRPWAHSVGVKRGREKAVLFKMADVMLNPGLVGLHVLDSFSAGLPMISTRNAMHSPEIVYLEDGKTGFLTEDSPHDYAKAVIDLLKNEQLKERMTQEAFIASGEYTVDRMAANFARGVLDFLGKRSR